MYKKMKRVEGGIGLCSISSGIECNAISKIALHQHQLLDLIPPDSDSRFLPPVSTLFYMQPEPATS